MISYLNTYNYSSSAVAASKEFTDIMCELPAAKFDRFIDLNGRIESNPWVLIQDCAQQNGMETSNYIDLYWHTIPQECQNRLNSLPGYSNQPISEGNVPCANMDYYSVEITNYPDFDNDGNPDTEAEIFQAFREKFTDLASGEKEDFQFSCNVPGNDEDTGDITWVFEPFTSQDGIDFISNDPIASILLIEADANIDGTWFDNVPTDDGAIIISGFSNNNWTISTITTPNNGSQPFSGNRQWGWIINQNGNLELFTRAVDVAKINKLFNILPGVNDECQQDTYYNIAEATWQNMQQEIAAWINDDEVSHGGHAEVIVPKAVRVDKEKIIEILTTTESIDQILNNCN